MFEIFYDFVEINQIADWTMANIFLDHFAISFAMTKNTQILNTLHPNFTNKQNRI